MARIKKKTKRAPPARRRNAEATRASILDAGRVHFARAGYDDANTRAIAADAGVDAALVSRYFGGKEQLFRAVLADVVKPEEIFHGDPAAFADRVSQLITGEAHDAAKLDGLMIVLHSASSPVAAAAVREVNEERFFQPLAQWIGGADGMPRAKLFATILMGMATMRSISTELRLSSAELRFLQQQLREIIHAILTRS